MDGALLINKHAGVSSFGVIELLQRALTEHRGLKRRDMPKIGHGGTLDPFATGLLVVCSGRAVKLARYFLGSAKTYEGHMRFGRTTIPGDPTAEISEQCDQVPGSLAELREMAAKFILQPYLQTPPMHSAKKKDGKPLYELARQGIEVEREPKLCHLYELDFQTYESPVATFRLLCSSGTYVRSLSQDFARLLGSVGMLDTLNRTASGSLNISNAWTVAQINEAMAAGRNWNELPCWIPFDRLLDGYVRAEATEDEREALFQGRQNVLFNIVKRTHEPALQSEGARTSAASRPPEDCLAIYCASRLIAIARREETGWGIERVFTRD